MAPGRFATHVGYGPWSSGLEVPMTAHAHPHPHGHPHFHPQVPLTRFAMDHPYAGEWALVTLGTLAALLLWYWNR